MKTARIYLLLDFCRFIDVCLEKEVVSADDVDQLSRENNPRRFSVVTLEFAKYYLSDEVRLAVAQWVSHEGYTARLFLTRDNRINLGTPLALEIPWNVRSLVAEIIEAGCLREAQQDELVRFFERFTENDITEGTLRGGIRT